MSKWYKVVINDAQWKVLCAAWNKDGVSAPFHPHGRKGRIKFTLYRRFFSEPKQSVQTGVIVGIYKFKDEYEAMAFKLEWG